MSCKVNNHDVTILVNSCDLYEDAWYPFFKLLQIQWPEAKKYDMILSTQTKKFNCDFLRIKTITSGDKPWSTRIINCLNQIQSKYVLYFLEDEFLQQPVNIKWWEKMLDFMEENADTGVIVVRHSPKQTKSFDEDFFPREELSKEYRIVGMAALYRRDYLLKLLRKHESVWEFEYYASKRSFRYNENVLQYNNRNPEVFVYNDELESGIGIKYEKWLPKNKELFEKYGINVDFENLGIYYGDSPPEKKQSTESRASKKIQKLKKNTNKRIRALRSKR